MIKGVPGEEFSDGNVSGYYNSEGDPVVCFERMSDADSDRYSIEVQNGEGYYDESGKYRSFHVYDD